MEQKNIMNSPKIAVRINAANPDHHLWNNNGTWFVHYTIHPTPLTKERIRGSLHTKNLVIARARRDRLLFETRAFPRIVQPENQP